MLDPTRQAQNCEFCGSAQLVPYEEAKPAFRPESVLPFKVSEPQARERIRAVVRQAVARAQRAQAQGAHRHGPRRLPAVLDVRRARRRRSGPPRPATTTTRRRPTRRTGRRARGRCSTCAGSPPPGALSALLRRRPRLRVGRRPSGAAARHRAVSDRRAQALRRRLRRRLGRRALPDRPRRARRSARATRWTRRSQALCAQQIPGDTFRNLSVRTDYSRPDVQAHPRAGVAAVLHLRRARPSSA